MKTTLCDCRGPVADLLDKLSGENGEEWLENLKKLLRRGTFPVIDCDAAPYVPERWQVEEHHGLGILEWDPTKLSLYLSKRQMGGKWILGHDLRKEIKAKPVLNANVLDWLLAHPDHIPEEWKGKLVFFWGTIYRDSGGFLCVRCLDWYGFRWDWHYRRLDVDWRDRSPAVLRASS